MTARTALVTGGGGGIGAAICRRLAEAGHRVAVADLAFERARHVAAEIDGGAVELDVTDPASVAGAVTGAAEALGPIEICVSCAGWDELRPFLDTDEAFQAKVIEINLAGPMRVTRAVLPAMVERSFGRIVNILRRRRVRLVARVGVLRSQGRSHRGHQGPSLVSSPRHGISANTVCPGPTDTPLLDAITEASADAERVIAGMTKAVPMRRLAQPDHVAPAVVFLASHGAGFITGQTLSVSGGLTMHDRSLWM